jgi:PAS domain S-box-containing protein
MTGQGDLGTEQAVSKAAEQLRQTESKIEALLAIAADAIIAFDEQLVITRFNEGAERIFGYARDEVLGRRLDMLIPERFHVAHAEHVRLFAATGTGARRMGERQEIYALRKDGGEFAAEASIACLNEDGGRSFLAVVRDVTERKRAEAMLTRSTAELEVRVAERTAELEQESRRREEAQAALIQAQRMEAFGQLTGGIAHDFNNLLTIVLGNLELLEPKLSEAEQRALLHRSVDAGQMGARLTSRLMSFARQRRLAPVVLDINELVLGLAEMLKRSLGKQVTLSTVLAKALWPTLADPSEVENAILNLAINARDAMPKGGKLLIETHNVTIDEALAAPEPGLRTGDYVCISVTDTGAGMSEEVAKRAFEPFFSTKQGRGTGLGLSTIYGFARQSGGHVTIRSAPGQGTTVRFCLPRSDGTAAAKAGEAELSVPLSENCETVLVVEDDDQVRELTLRRFEGLGYVVLEAEDAEAAIALLNSESDIALVFSDIILGQGRSGVELGRWVCANKPGIKVLLTTGFASDAAGGEHANEEFPILHKPYRRAELAVAVHAALHGAAD